MKKELLMVMGMVLLASIWMSGCDSSEQKVISAWRGSLETKAWDTIIRIDFREGHQVCWYTTGFVHNYYCGTYDFLLEGKITLKFQLEEQTFTYRQDGDQLFLDGNLFTRVQS